MVFQLTIIVAHVGLEIAYMQVAIAGYYQKHVAFLSEFNLVGKFAWSPKLTEEDKLNEKRFRK